MHMWFEPATFVVYSRVVIFVWLYRVFMTIHMSQHFGPFMRPGGSRFRTQRHHPFMRLYEPVYSTSTRGAPGDVDGPLHYDEGIAAAEAHHADPFAPQLAQYSGLRRLLPSQRDDLLRLNAGTTAGRR